MGVQQHFGSIGDSIILSGMSNDDSGDYECIVFAPNTEGDGGCTVFMTFDETDDTEQLRNFPCLEGTVFLFQLSTLVADFRRGSYYRLVQKNFIPCLNFPP